MAQQIIKAIDSGITLEQVMRAFDLTLDQVLVILNAHFEYA